MLLAAMPAVAETASGGSETHDQTDMAAVPQHKLAPAVRQAVLLDPQVSEATARACQMAHKLGLTRAEGRPKVTATISGSRQLASRIKKVPPLQRDPNNIFRTLPESSKRREIRLTGAHTREFDHREKNNLYDAKLSLRYTLFDWGQRRNLTEASLLAFEVAQIDARDVLRSRSYELVRLALSLQRMGDLLRLHEQTLERVNTHVADVQPGQVARISLAAYDPSRYGVVMGVVRRVASNTTQPENAMPFYETIIAIPEVAFTKSPEQPVITSGMPLQVDILGGKRTVMEYIMTPIQKSLATAFRET